MEDFAPTPGATKSLVWTYFDLVAGADGKPANEEKPWCRECGRTVATKGSNTSSLLSHFRNSHPTIFSRIKGSIGGAAIAKRSLPSGSGGQQQTLASSFAKLPHTRDSLARQTVMQLQGGGTVWSHEPGFRGMAARILAAQSDHSMAN